jgi:ribosomal RNA-processing protein 12
MNNAHPLYLLFHSVISLQRAWLLPLMKTAAMMTGPERPHLSFFQGEVLSLARQCDALTVKHPTKAAFHQSQVVALWALLPCFCRHPADLDPAFPPLAAIIVRAMGDKRYPQLVVSRLTAWKLRLGVFFST